MINMFIVVLMYVINRIEDDCWFGVVFNLLKELKIYFYFKDFIFFIYVLNVEFVDF